MRKIDQATLKQILEAHKEWLESDGKSGERANLSDSNLSYSDLRGSNLSYSDLRGSNLSGSNLRGSNLSGSNLSDSNLSGSDLRGSNLSGSNLSDSNLSYSNLSGSNLRGSNLRGSNLSDSNLSDSNLSGVIANERTTGFWLCCPETGEFTAYKKCRNNRIVTLLITADAKRSSATTRKCRASKAIVVSIDDGTNQFEEAVSKQDSNFVYKVGHTIEVADFDENRWNECSTGIHFFITRREAEVY